MQQYNVGIWTCVFINKQNILVDNIIIYVRMFK